MVIFLSQEKYDSFIISFLGENKSQLRGKLVLQKIILQSETDREHIKAALTRKIWKWAMKSWHSGNMSVCLQFPGKCSCSYCNKISFFPGLIPLTYVELMFPCLRNLQCTELLSACQNRLNLYDLWLKLILPLALVMRTWSISSTPLI